MASYRPAPGETSWSMGPGEMTGQTVDYSGHQYKVYRTFEPDAMGSRYVLCGPRDSRYILMPNRPNPELLFPVNLRNGNSKTVFRNQWFKLIGDQILVVR